MATLFEDRKLQLARINQLAILVGVIFFVLLGRLWYLQIAMGDELLMQSEANRIKVLRSRAPRGTILDRKGRILATSRPQFVVMANPDDLKKNPEAMHTLCGVLGMTPKEIDDIIAESEARPGSPVRLAVDVPMETFVRIGELRMKLPGVSVELDNLRYYPDGQAVAHIMGQLGEIGKEELEEATKAGKGYRPGDYVGKAGLEKQYEDYLRGIDGGKMIEVNAMGHVVRVLGEPKPSIQGKVVKLSIDRDLQVAGARALGKQVGAVVALDPRNGAVLAMVSSPSYDPNVFVKKIKVADWRQIMDNPNKPLQNRNIRNVYPPGSTFKPITATAGLVYDVWDFTTTCSRGAHVAGRFFGCWKHHMGIVDFDRAMAESCDAYYYKLGMKLGVDRLAHVARQFGVSYATGVDLPNEVSGTMPDTEWKRKTFANRSKDWQKWWPGETPSVSIGQGAIQMSTLQLAVAIGAVGNGGTVYKPRLMAEIMEPDELGTVIRRSKPEVARRVVDAKPEHLEQVRKAMRLTVTHGTGRVADVPGVAVAGKTGSAECNGPAHAWFVCFAPVEKPEIVVACLVEHGRHGASAAAPVCRAILDVYYGKKKPSEIGQGNARVSGD